MKKFLLIFCVFITLPVSACADSLWHTSPDQWSEPRTFHSPFDDEFSKGIVVSRGKIDPGPDIKKVFSSNNAYWYAVQGADYTKVGPYSTNILIYNERKGYLIDLQLIEHSQYEPNIKWINEKLIYVDVWWGRILGSSIIFDVEKEQIIYKEMMHDGVIPYQQYHQNIK